MSSTNHTTNYNLPQFVGTDKPAWLGDVNPAMSAIDTAMHTNATKAQQGIDDAATAKSRADDAYTLADSANTAAGTAQLTANSAVSGLSTFEAKFNLSNASSASNPTISTTGSGSVIGNTLKLVQNSDGSVYKFYGYCQILTGTATTSIVKNTAVPGLTGYYGTPTGCFLTTAPDEAYLVDTGGWMFANDETNVFQNLRVNFAVGTDGQIYMFAYDWNDSITIRSGASVQISMPACLYFNSNFGDVS